MSISLTRCDAILKQTNLHFIHILPPLPLSVFWVAEGGNAQAHNDKGLMVGGKTEQAGCAALFAEQIKTGMASSLLLVHPFLALDYKLIYSERPFV